MTSDKKLYLLNFWGPNFLARFVTLFEDLKSKEIATIDFQYQSHIAFGSGLLCLEASVNKEEYILHYAEDLAWNSSFVSSRLPEFYRSQNIDHCDEVKFLLLDDQYKYVIKGIKKAYGATLEEGIDRSQKTYRFKLPGGQIWYFVCAESLQVARETLSRYSTKDFDILLLDMKLNTSATTKHEGIEFLRDLKTENRFLPVVVITQGEVASKDSTPAEWDPATVGEYWKEGAWDFLYKRVISPRLEHTIDLIVDRCVESLVIVVTSNDLSQDLAYLFRFLRDQPVKVIRASGVPNFRNSMLDRNNASSSIRLVLECTKHKSISTNDIADMFYRTAVAEGKGTDEIVRKWIRFHHGKIYEQMQLT